MTDAKTVSDVFREYVRQVLAPTLGRGDLVVPDNLSSHKDTQALRLIEAAGAEARRDFERELPEERDWSKIEPGLEVKLCAAPDGSREVFVLCRSHLRAEKEKAIRSRQAEKLAKALEKMQASAQAPQRALRDRDRALVRMGRLMSQFSRGAPVRHRDFRISRS